MPQSMKKGEKVSEIRASGIFRIRKDILSNYLWTRLIRTIDTKKIKIKTKKYHIQPSSSPIRIKMLRGRH